MKQVKFEVIGPPDAKLEIDDWELLMAALTRRLPGCKPGTVDELIPGSERFPVDPRPVGRPGDTVLNVVGVTSVYFEVGDEMRLLDALQVANDALHEIGRDDLRVELREL